MGFKMQSKNILRFFASKALDSMVETADQPANKQISIFNMSLRNRSGGAAKVGLGYSLRINSAFVSVFKVDDSATPKSTVVTTDVLAGTATRFFEANNDGIIIQSAQKFSLLDLVASIYDKSGGTFVLQYYNGTAFTNVLSVEDMFTAVATGTNFGCIIAPLDWQKGCPAAHRPTTGSNEDWYTLFIKSTTAPTQAPSITGLRLGDLFDYAEAIADNAALEISFNDDHPHTLEFGEYPTAYISSANTGNLCKTSFTVV